MAERRHQVEKFDGYDRLINRLGLALDMAKTSVRLRDDSPLELELRGLSPAEYQFIEAYLDRSEDDVREGVPAARNAVLRTLWEPSAPMRAPRPAANVIWLKDQCRAKVSAKLSRYSSSKHFKR